MALCVRYVDKKGMVVERFLGIVNVADTTALSLTEAIIALLNDNSLSLSSVCGQGYDGASNMKLSCKRKDMLRGKQVETVVKALEDGEIESGKGLNQELALGRPGDTRWGSHYKLILNVIALYPRRKTRGRLDTTHYHHYRIEVFL
ncbi:uncharacterized protein [Spinacia oleracea]|uniref:DUF4371 domain-containing protein n=1 Tax=Spinacia oleracea TaxID=3562 RepID=A0ABM3R1S1_SPIOL|nr:uncharacterized protein LOC110793753 [Spinacia oleracea]